MLWPFALVSVEMILFGIVLCALAWHSRRGLKLNPWWGLRTKRTMASTDAFTQANRAIWPIYGFQAGTCLMTGLAVLTVGVLNNEAFLLLAILSGGCALVLIMAELAGHIRGHRSLSHRHHSLRPPSQD